MVSLSSPFMRGNLVMGRLCKTFRGRLSTKPWDVYARDIYTRRLCADKLERLRARTDFFFISAF